MKRFWMLFLFLTLPLAAQEIKGLDKEFYNAYLDNLPDEKKKRLQMLKKNLLNLLQKVIPREDPDNGPAFAGKLNADAFQFEELNAQSPFVRGMAKEIPGFRQDKFMYIIKTGPYLVYAAFDANPGLYVTSETQRYVIIRKLDEHPN